MQVGPSSNGWVLTMDPAQEVHLHGMLGHAVLELVEQLAASAQGHVLLVELQQQNLGSVSGSESCLRLPPLDMGETLRGSLRTGLRNCVNQLNGCMTN